MRPAMTWWGAGAGSGAACDEPRAAGRCRYVATLGRSWPACAPAAASGASWRGFEAGERAECTVGGDDAASATNS